MSRLKQFKVPRMGQPRRSRFVNLPEIGLRFGPTKVQHRLANTSRIFAREPPRLKGWQITLEDGVCIRHPPSKVSWRQRLVKYRAKVNTCYLLGESLDRISLMARTIHGCCLHHDLTERLRVAENRRQRGLE